MGIVTTIPEKCRRCYTCIRECPANAIKVEHGQATVIADRCIACGNCIKVCAMKAKQVASHVAEARGLLASGGEVFACLAPSFSAAFDLAARRQAVLQWYEPPAPDAVLAPYHPGKIIAALRRLGFREVWEVAFGAELVGREYARQYRARKNTGQFMIATPCPALVSYVEKYMPTLVTSLAPIASPMAATARAIRRRHGAAARVVFVGPCIAKKAEIQDSGGAGNADVALTYDELSALLDEAGIALGDLEPGGFDGPRAGIGRSFPISGGLLKTSGLSTDILATDIITTEGKDRALALLLELESARCRSEFVDVLFCEGCIAGPIMANDLSVFARKQLLTQFMEEQRAADDPKAAAEALAEFADLDLSRTFTYRNISLPQPTEEEIQRVLATMRKSGPDDQLNCGACGYRTCREKAVAVCQGLAEAEMCLHYLVEELEATCRELQKSNEDLASAQERLVQTERLASLGQLSAGVATTCSSSFRPATPSATASP